MTPKFAGVDFSSALSSSPKIILRLPFVFFNNTTPPNALFQSLRGCNEY